MSAKPPPRLFAPAPALAALALAFATAAAGAAGNLVVISPHNEAIRFEFEQGFSAWHEQRFHAGVDIDWRIVGGSSESIRFVQSEFARKPDGIEIDVFFGGGHEPFLELNARGLLDPSPLAPDILEGLPADVAGIELRADNFAWHGAAISSFGILENLRVLRLAGLPRVETWRDLTQPGLMGWVGAGDPRGSGTMHVMFESFLQAEGWERGWQLLARLGGNTRRFDRISSTTAKDCALGESAYALAIDFYAFTQIAAAGRDHLTYVLPADFAAVSPDGIAILRGAPHRELAERFITFVLSEAGQKLWFLPRGHPEGPRRFSIERMPVRPALYEALREESNIEYSPFTPRGEFRYNGPLAQQRRGVVATLAGAALVDTHADLKEAWRAVIARGLRPADLEELGRPPISGEEALRLSREEWRDPARRNAFKIQWQTWSRDKYRRIARGD